jgi:hypothetical protein
VTRAIRALILKACKEYRQDGVVSVDLQTELMSEGYDISQLDREVERITHYNGDV